MTFPNFSLRALFPCGDDMVCIIDDREDVWQGCGNLVQVKPYHFFRHTGDIHAPPGLEKRNVVEIPERVYEAVKEEKDSVLNIEKEKTEENGILAKEIEDLKAEEEVSKGEDNPPKNLEATIGITESSEEKQMESKENSEPTNEEGSKNEPEAVNVEEEPESKQNPADTHEDKPENEQSIEKCEEGSKIEENVEKSQDENPTSPGNSLDKISETGQDPENGEQNESNEANEKEKIKLLEKPASTVNENSKGEEVDHEDHDDYLLYLEDILRKIHAEFYECLDQGKGRKSLREIIPRVRARVLKGLCLTFSGLIPTHQKLHQSRAYKVAKAFGAEVTQVMIKRPTNFSKIIRL